VAIGKLIIEYRRVPFLPYVGQSLLRIVTGWPGINLQTRLMQLAADKAKQEIALGPIALRDTAQQGGLVGNPLAALSPAVPRAVPQAGGGAIVTSAADASAALTALAKLVLPRLVTQPQGGSVAQPINGTGVAVQGAFLGSATGGAAAGSGKPGEGFITFDGVRVGTITSVQEPPPNVIGPMLLPLNPPAVKAKDDKIS